MFQVYIFFKLNQDKKGISSPNTTAFGSKDYSQHECLNSQIHELGDASGQLIKHRRK